MAKFLPVKKPILPPYPQDPLAITRLSFERIDRACPLLASLSPSLRVLARRMVHACGQPDIVPSIKASDNFVEEVQKLRHESPHRLPLAEIPIFCDSAMLCAAIATRAPHARCFTHTPAAKLKAREQNITRAMAAIDLYCQQAGEEVAKTIFLFGSAPTALLRLLQHCYVERSVQLPAALFAFPVGFVSASESKQALLECVESNLPHKPPPYITLVGRLGGSALAAAAFNATFDDEADAISMGRVA